MLKKILEGKKAREIILEGIGDSFGASSGDLISTPFDEELAVTNYLAAALWSSVDDKDDPLDQNYSLLDVSDEAKKQAQDDVHRFVKTAGAMLKDQNPEQVGHDFWLTRNHHGAGFWDRPSIYGQELADKLTELAQSFGELTAYVGDEDKQIYFE